ncbi:MAG TPA: carboxypeptidase-like regulatory domain-containing protein [Dictyobacter sp.]|jgi:5-hydroxyisourate hydrolase-like protein (transthyretin family)|nr:carboxypeptidase-like regulatory domain-containing protein [Dictyobacter sp.]
MKKLIIKMLSISSILLLLLISSLLFMPSGFVHAATQSGHITGQLLNGSEHNAPVSNQIVTLQEAQGNNAKDLAKTKTDAHGNYSFPQLSTDETISYAVYINYQGAQYVSNVVSLAQKPVQRVNLTIYQAMYSTKNVAIVQSTVLVNQAQAGKGLMSVSEAFSFQNLNTKSFVGSLDASKGKPNALFFSLPVGAKNIALGQGFSGYQVIQVDRGFATNAALLPGSNDFSFSFEIPYTTSTYAFDYVPMYPTVQLTFMVATDFHVGATKLTSQGIVNANQKSYHSFNTTGLLAQQDVQVGLDNLPLPQETISSSPARANMLWLVVAALGLLAIVALTWYLYQNRGRGGNRQGKKVSSSVNTEKVKDEAVVDSPQGADREQELLQALLKLDKEHEEGQIDKAAYEARRGKLKARLRLMMSEREISRR